MVIINIQKLFYIAPAVIAIVLILFGSNFKDESRPIISKNINIIFTLFYILFGAIWALAEFGMFLNYVPGSDKLAGSYLLGAFSLSIYKYFVKNKTIKTHE